MKIVKIALIVMMIFSITAYLYAETTNISIGRTGVKSAKAPASRGPAMKAERGVKNILFGWTDIPKTVIQVTRESKNPLWGLVGGTIKGVAKAFPRTVSGAADLISFPMGDYNKMPVKPDEINTQIR